MWIPAGNTGMEPGKTSFFQALGVPTKIARGTIEITTDLKLVEAGTKVGPSEATLLNMLNISPFTYGMGVAQVYDEGQTFPASVLDIGEEQLLATLSQCITTIASISLALNFPTVPAVIHSVVNSYKKVLAVAIETEISWPEIEELKDRIANPDAYAAAAPAAGAGAGAAEAAKPAEEEKEESEEEDEGFGGLLYVASPIGYYEIKLTCNAATKQAHDDGYVGLEFRASIRFSRHGSLCPELNRSLTGQLNPLQRENETRFSTSARCNGDS